MIQVDLPAAFTLGHFFGLISGKYLKTEPRYFSSRLLGLVNIYMACCFAPIGVFLLVGWPSWEMLYTTGWAENPYDSPARAGFYVGFYMAMILLCNAGYILAHRLFRTGRDRLVRAIVIAGTCVSLSPFLYGSGYWQRVGTYAEVKAGGGYSYLQTPFLTGWVITIGGSLVLTFIFSRIFKKMTDNLTAGPE